MISHSSLLYINTADELAGFCEQLRTVSWIALDTEFLREKTYYPKLCLLQIATRDIVACIDTLALDDLSPLLDVIFDEGILKVMHSGRQDMEIFYHLRASAPAPVFDTQIAALLLGHSEQIGYGNLVKEVLGIELDKLHTRADWSLRPLSDDQVKYAADDVIYLVELYLKMRERLQDLGRLAWLDDDFQKLSDTGLYSNPPARAWLKVKGANRLRGSSLAILQALAHWRESLAQQKNRPKGWIMRDDALVDIARHKPGSLAALGKIRGLNEGVIRNSGQDILDTIHSATDQKPAAHPDTGRKIKLSPDQDALVDVMMAIVRLSGAENDLNPAVLGTRKQLEKLVQGETDIDIMQGWRRQLVGEQLTAFINGELNLSVSGHKLVIAD